MKSKVEKENNEVHKKDRYEEMAQKMTEWTWDLKALNTIAIDLRGKVSYTDFIVIATGNSERHVQSIARHVEAKMKQEFDVMAYGREGLEFGRWALVDFGDLILHVFNGPLREEYDLERMWPDARRLQFEDAPKSLYGHFEMEAFENL